MGFYFVILVVAYFASIWVGVRIQTTKKLNALLDMNTSLTSLRITYWLLMLAVFISSMLCAAVYMAGPM